MTQISWTGGHVHVAFEGVQGGDTVLLAVGLGDMSQRTFQAGTVDAFVNRGSIFYLPVDGIAATMECILEALSVGGQRSFPLNRSGFSL